jgi:DNA (cytosine-5)-methyltransferase 1
MQVRRLTPIECERLQGFPDNHTAIPHKGKPAADGPRYKAIGNSMAVPVMAWIGRRIQMVDEIIKVEPKGVK